MTFLQYKLSQVKTAGSTDIDASGVHKRQSTWSALWKLKERAARHTNPHLCTYTPLVQVVERCGLAVVAEDWAAILEGLLVKRLGLAARVGGLSALYLHTLNLCRSCWA